MKPKGYLIKKEAKGRRNRRRERSRRRSKRRERSRRRKKKDGVRQRERWHHEILSTKNKLSENTARFDLMRKTIICIFEK
jgi:hypothetical protein